MRVVESPKSTSGTCVHLHFLSSVFKPCARLAMVVVGLTVTLFAHHLHLHYAFKKNPLSLVAFLLTTMMLTKNIALFIVAVLQQQS